MAQNLRNIGAFSTNKKEYWVKAANWDFCRYLESISFPFGNLIFRNTAVYHISCELIWVLPIIYKTTIPKQQRAFTKNQPKVQQQIILEIQCPTGVTYLRTSIGTWILQFSDNFCIVSNSVTRAFLARKITY